MIKIAVLALCATAVAASVYVDTTNGPVVGYQTSLAKVWKGIPYAASTAGSNRWRPPVAPDRWTQPRESFFWGFSCPSTDHNADVPKNASENCLNLNVYVPSSATNTSKLSTMVFFHGGAFKEGSNRGPFGLYDGSHMAAQGNVVIVTSNYRLGALGFLSVNTQKGDTGNPVEGNFGILDQRMALEWVRDNIAGFGGNPDDVTLWGESAGAMSAGIHLISPGSRGLFHKVIMESNPTGFGYLPDDKAAFYGNSVCDELHCSTGNGGCNVDCMRSQNLTMVTEAWRKAAGNVFDFILANYGKWIDGFLQFVPTIDGTIVPSEVIPALQAGKFDTSIPLLFGTNANEGATFIYAGVKFDLPEVLYEAALWAIFGSTETAGEILKRYNGGVTPDPFNNTVDGRTSLGYVLTDFWFRCASEQFALAATKAGTNAFVYRYTHIFSNSSLFPHFGLPAICGNDTCHASELPFVFNNIPNIPGYPIHFTPEEQQLAKTFVSYWTDFAKYGDPNAGGAKPMKWPVWDSDSRPNLRLNTTLATESSKDLCEFWDKIGYDY